MVGDRGTTGLALVVLLTAGSAASASLAEDIALLQVSDLRKPQVDADTSTSPPEALTETGKDLHLTTAFRQDALWCVDESGSPFISTSGKRCDCKATQDDDIATIWDPTHLPTGYNKWWLQFDFRRPLKLTGIQLMSMGDTKHDIKKLVLQAAASKTADFDTNSEDILHMHVQAGTEELQMSNINLKPWQGVQHLRLLVESTHSGWQPWLREVGFRYEQEPEGEVHLWPALDQEASGSECVDHDKLVAGAAAMDGYDGDAIHGCSDVPASWCSSARHGAFMRKVCCQRCSPTPAAKAKKAAEAPAMKARKA